MSPSTVRRPLLAVIGDASATPRSAAGRAAFDVGRLAVDAGFRVVTGGLGGVMAQACRGARASSAYREGDTIGILPQANPSNANEWVDVAIATGLGDARNLLVANSDAVVAIGGGAGTLSEIAFAWMRRRPIVALAVPGWAADVAGRALDRRSKFGRIGAAVVFAAESPRQAVGIAAREWTHHARRPGNLHDTVLTDHPPSPPKRPHK